MPTKRLAIIGRGYTHHPPEVKAECGARAETAVLRDPLHGNIRGLQLALSREDALVEQPLQRSGPRDLPKAAGEGAGGHTRVRRHAFHCEGLIEVRASPFEGLRQWPFAGT